MTVAVGQAGAARRVHATRRGYLDWLRGIAVLLMIEAHLLDSWTAFPDRSTAAYRSAMIVGGMGSVLFLLLAGVAVGLSAGSKERRHGDIAAASRAVARRGLEIFALAFLFRLQAWILGWSPHSRDLLKVDILNIMGPSIVFAALLWRLSDTVRGRCTLFAAVTIATVFLGPLMRLAPLGALPDPIEAYIVPVAGLSSFVFFPWMGFVFAGACIGVLIDAAATGEREKRLNIAFGLAGAALAAGAYWASHLPSMYQNVDFWTSSPSYFLIRLGVLMLGIAVVYGWNASFVPPGRWSPLIQLGKTSLFIYWIHVEMVYGLVSRPLHRSLATGQVWLALGAFTVFMLICSLAKERLASRVQGAGCKVQGSGSRFRFKVP